MARTAAPAPSRARTLLLLVLLLLGCAVSAAAQSVSGEALYQRRCAACHDNADGRTPPKQALQNMTPSRILRTLDFGAMMTDRVYAQPRGARGGGQVSRQAGTGAGAAAGGLLRRPHGAADRDVGAAWNGWSAARDNTRFVPAALAGLVGERCPAAEAEMGVRLRGRHLGVRRSRR